MKYVIGVVAITVGVISLVLCIVYTYKTIWSLPVMIQTGDYRNLQITASAWFTAYLSLKTVDAIEAYLED